MNEEWGTPISKDKIIYRRNKLIEYQKIGEVRFTPLYEAIDENILDINYMIYEIDQLTNNWNELEDAIDNEVNYYIEDEDAEWFEAKKIQNIMKEIKEGKNE